MGTEKEEEGENRENRRTMNFEQKAENGRKHANEKTFSPLLSPSLPGGLSGALVCRCAALVGFRWGGQAREPVHGEVGSGASCGPNLTGVIP